VFQVNGKNIVIRGGGYVEDLMLRPSNERVDADIRYLKIHEHERAEDGSSPWFRLSFRAL